MHSEGAQMIVDERTRQVEKEGYTAEHDQGHENHELAVAARCYVDEFMGHGNRVPAVWPWADEFWKPDEIDVVRNLVKAGALIAAQIDKELAIYDRIGEAIQPIHQPIDLSS